MSQVTSQPSTTRIWEWLDAVPDPEVPVISLVDLGIIRDVAWEGPTLVVTVTPTYSGCPATSVIAMDIETALRDHGISDLKLKTQISLPGRPTGCRRRAAPGWRTTASRRPSPQAALKNARTAAAKMSPV